MINFIFPLFSAVDRLMASAVPTLARICLWGALAGVLSVAIYAWLSPQDKIAGYKEQLKKYRRELMGNEELDFSEYMAISRKNLKTSMLFLCSAIGPALVSAVPVILILLWVHTALGYSAPEGLSAEVPGKDIKLQLNMEAGKVIVKTADRVLYRGDPLNPPVPSVTAREWWNILLESPAGYLTDEAGVEKIRFNTRERRFVEFMPGWGEGVEFPYFVFVFITALFGRLIFGIK